MTPKWLVHGMVYYWILRHDMTIYETVNTLNLDISYIYIYYIYAMPCCTYIFKKKKHRKDYKSKQYSQLQHAESTVAGRSLVTSEPVSSRPKGRVLPADGSQTTSMFIRRFPI